MSWEMLGLCAEKEFRTPTRKQTIMYLADKASSNGEGIWCSKYRVARETELSLATVKRVFREFVREGILIETGLKDCDRGYTKVYRISVEAVELLADLKKFDEEYATGVSVHPVHSDPPTGSGLTPVPGSPGTPNHSQTIQEPSLLDVVIADFWDAYPKDRRRNFQKCKDIIRLSITGGVAPSDMLEAVKSYSSETREYKRCRVFFADNWLRQRKWEEHVERKAADAEVAEVNALRVATQNAAWIIERGFMCKHITPSQAIDAIQRGLVTEKQARLAGVLR